MSEPIKTVLTPFNPLDGMSFEAGAGPDILMRPAADCARFNLRIQTEQLKKATTAFDMDIPEGVGSMILVAEKSALCLGPDEWLLLAPQKPHKKLLRVFPN